MAEIFDRVLADRPCPLTGTREAEVVASRSRDGGFLRNVMSRESGIIYVDPLPVADLAHFYREDYRVSYKRVVEPKPKHILRAGRVCLDRLRHSGGVIKAGMHCLDIGAGGGEWVYLMKSLGCDSYGVEPNTGYGNFARDNYGVDIHLGMYQESSYPLESFDVLTLFHVLEHLDDPVADLRRMSEYLKPEGRFLIEVPDILFGGMRFAHKWHNGHLFGFDALTLEAVAAKAGLRRINLKVVGGNLFGVFEKATDGFVPLPDLRGHFESAKASLLSGKSRYWTLPGTYGKIPRRFLNQFLEEQAVRGRTSPKVILDKTFGAVLPS